MTLNKVSMLLFLAVIMRIFRLPGVWLLICISPIAMSGATDKNDIGNLHASIQDLLQWYVTPAKVFHDKLIIAINIRLEDMSSTLTILENFLPLISHVQPRNLGIDFRSKIGQLGSSLSRVYSALGHINKPDIVSAKTAHELTELFGKNITSNFNDKFEKSSGIFYQQGKLLRKINEHPLWFPNWATTWVSKQPSRLIKSVRG